MNRKTLIAEKIAREQIWDIPGTEFKLIGNLDQTLTKQMLDVIVDSEVVGHVSHKLAQQLFNYWLYPYGSVVHDEGNAAKLNRKRDYDLNTDIPRQDLEQR